MTIKRKTKSRGSIDRWGSAPDCWRVRLTFGPGQRFSKIVHGSKADAEAVLREQVTRKVAGDVAPARRQRLREWVDEYLRDYTPKLDARTRDDYRAVLTRYALPALGDLYLPKITRGHVQHLVGDLMRRGLSATTVRSAHRVLRTCLRAAVKDDRLAADPCRSTELPGEATPDPRPLTASEVGRLLDAAAGTPWEALVATMVDSGVRVAEAMGLRWDDIDETGVLTVRRSLKRPKGRPWVLGPTKTKRQRPIPLGADTIAALERHRWRQDGARRLAGAAWVEHGLIFTNARGGPARPQLIQVEHFAPLLVAAKCPAITLRQLRHTCGQLVRDLGDVKDASERLGHSGIGITERYYLAPSTARQHDMAQRMAGLRAANRKAVG